VAYVIADSSRERGDGEVPAVDQQEDQDLERQRDNHRRIIIIPIESSTEATTMSMMMNGM